MAVDSLVPIINGVAYTHADIKLNILGVDIIGLIDINYGDTQTITENFSTGNDPTSVGFGQNVNTASITVSFEAMQVIQQAAAAVGGKIQNIPFFQLGINYSAEGQPLVRDILTQCRFKGRQNSSSTGNSEIPITLELFVAKIRYNV